MSSFMPPVLTRVKVFQARIVTVFDAAANRWVIDTVASDPGLEQQLDEWFNKTRAAVQQVSPPSVSVYQANELQQILYAGISVMYVPAVEGATSERPAVTSKPASVAKVAVKAKPSGTNSAGVFKPKR